MFLPGIALLIIFSLSSPSSSPNRPAPSQTLPLKSGTETQTETPSPDPTNAPAADPELEPDILYPQTGLLAAGTAEITLRVTTSFPANCRWDERPQTAYENMEHEFSGGQGTTFHAAQVSGLENLDNRWFYARCRSLPDQGQQTEAEYQTHLRVLGPWNPGYPRIADLWNIFDEDTPISYYASNDLYIPGWWRDPAETADTIRSINPNAKILLSLDASYGWPEIDRLATEWWNAEEGEPGYQCLLRDSAGEIILIEYWRHPMYNLTILHCREALAAENARLFLSSDEDAGADLTYDGIFWDNLFDWVSWLADDIDSDLNGAPDDPALLDEAYRIGMADFLNRVRAALPNAIFVANEAAEEHAQWINGRLYEWQLYEILNRSDVEPWADMIRQYQAWNDLGVEPRLTYIQSKPEPIYGEKYPFQSEHINPLPMQEEAASSYQRMRFGVTSALMGNGLFDYDLRSESGKQWWYDEFGAQIGDETSTLPPHGYLGQPTGEPFLLEDALNSPNLLRNASFERSFSRWDWYVNYGSGAAATFILAKNPDQRSEQIAKINIETNHDPWSVLLMQGEFSIEAGQSYTLSFWARSTNNQIVSVKVAQAEPPGENYGFSGTIELTDQWQQYFLTDTVDVSADDAELVLMLGETEGEMWLDHITFQQGSLGVWARTYDHGLAVVNTTWDAHTVELPNTYCKLNGSQAPLFQARVDDDEASPSTGWIQREANDNQFGRTVMEAVNVPNAAITYTPELAYAGRYEVFAWVEPSSVLSDSVPVTIQHAEGETTVILNQTSGNLGWHSLGQYGFDAGTGGSAVLMSGGNAKVTADAIKWVSTERYNDGTQVNQITLQPQDGIILLSECHIP